MLYLKNMKLQSIFSDPELLENLNKFSKVQTIKKGQVLFSPGEPLVYIPLILKGVLRILRVNDDGRDFFLYHLYPGQTCAMSINCCRIGHKGMVKAIAEDDTELVQIPTAMIESWLRFPEWKIFINISYSYRIEELVNLVDLIAFNNMDSRLLYYLEQRARALKTNVLTITHQHIADEMHTHREAISRLLRTMEQKGMVKLGRNTIELL